METLSFYTTV